MYAYKVANLYPKIILGFRLPKLLDKPKVTRANSFKLEYNYSIIAYYLQMIGRFKSIQKLESRYSREDHAIIKFIDAVLL